MSSRVTRTLTQTFMSKNASGVPCIGYHKGFPPQKADNSSGATVIPLVINHRPTQTLGALKFFLFIFKLFRVGALS